VIKNLEPGTRNFLTVRDAGGSLSAASQESAGVIAFIYHRNCWKRSEQNMIVAYVPDAWMNIQHPSYQIMEENKVEAVSKVN